MEASRTETRSDDLSISELSLRDPSLRASSRPFSLLNQSGSARPADSNDGDVRNGISGGVSNTEETERYLLEESEKRRRLAAKSREERLEHDVFVLRKLNSAFSMYYDALRETRSGTERVAEKLEQTNALLDKYVAILAKSEATTRLVLDDRWHGADKDEEFLEEEMFQKQEKARQEEKERLLARRREEERLEREEREKQEREEKERTQTEKREKLARKAGYGGVRIVRGTRARGAARAVSTSSRGRKTTTSSASHPTSSASVRSTTSAVPSRTGIK